MIHLVGSPFKKGDTRKRIQPTEGYNMARLSLTRELASMMPRRALTERFPVGSHGTKIAIKFPMYAFWTVVDWDMGSTDRVKEAFSLIMERFLLAWDSDVP